MAEISARRIIDVLTRIPKHIEWRDVGTNAAIGAGLGLVPALMLSNKKNRLRNSLIGLGIGAGLGGYSSMVARNVREEMGGHFRNNPDYYDPDKLVEMAGRSGKKRITLYVPGASDSPGGVAFEPEDYENNGVFTFHWGDRLPLSRAIQALKDNGYAVDVIGHSAGSTGVFGALRDLPSGYQADSVSLLDPVDLHWRALLPESVRNYSGTLNTRAGDSMVHLARQRDLTDNAVVNSSNKWVAHNPLAVTWFPGIDTKWHDDNHAMWSVGLRRPLTNHGARAYIDSLQETLNRYFNR